MQGSVFKYVRLLFFNEQYFWITASLVVLGDAILTQLIMRFVPYTEIDWETYMVHIDLYLKGERNYVNITGPTGPLVYPAGHVYIHRLLHLITDSGRNVAQAQQIYGGLYVLSIALVCVIYKKAKVPNWTLLLLPLSKRLHSIFVLRLFNDCWSLIFVQAAILAFQSAWDDVGILLFSLALSVKMSAILYLPGLLVILFKRHGLFATVRHMLVLACTQTLLARSFLIANTKSYMRNAFDLSRVFLYKWTVNWRFVDERTFLSPAWAKGLLLGHVTVLIAFGLFRWCRGDGGVARVLQRGLWRPGRPAGLAPVDPDYVVTVLTTSNLIGIIFARSLHYQFYSWYAQQLPLLTQRTRFPFIVQMALIGTIEYAWNVYPSTPLSSGLLLAANLVMLLGIWFGYPEGKVFSKRSNLSQVSPKRLSQKQ
ncbi:glycosyltransferase family 58 protein [Suillus subaureus]|uniref:Dol-P-Man:Man(5)GlcNAc(2)-PP-Dol alpha-1,3-mannosyltransferase n=1 Tax=Suillus subaureus TaxID=48587 RepID=A0A9P7JJR5_9AGAM|nr:glycosyltransferase family 58 protein [Suillus subaureus]KAG1827034.1 glycosyltransferase family 58 protein [Suillus subaureus]